MAKEGFVEVNEKRRTYFYDGHQETRYVDIRNVKEIKVSASGNHYVTEEISDGNKTYRRLHIIAPGWRNIEIDPGEKNDWTL